MSDPYGDLRQVKPDHKAVSEGGVSRPKPAKNKRKKASPERWAAIRAKKCVACRICKTTVGHIHAHHIIRQGSDLWTSVDTENNVVGLCGQCHQDLHNGKDAVKKALRFLLTPAEVAYTDKKAYAGYVDDIYFRLRPAGRNPGTLKEDAA